MKARGYDVDSRDEAPPSGGPERDRHSASTTLLDLTPVADPKADAPVRRLVPFSGIQFLNLEIDAGVLPMISTWFTEEEIDAPTGKRRVLLPLHNENTPDGSVFHPVTFRPLGPADTLSYSGLEAIEPLLDQWIPLPFLRYLGRGPSGETRLDQGPSNWVRIFVETPVSGLRAAGRLRAVLALDTRLDGTSRADDSPYLAPNVEDALFASTFLFVDDPEQVSGFLSQPWVDAWLRDAVPSVARADRFTLAHLARYIGFLKVLAKASAMPRLRFIDSVSQTLPLPTVGLDLVIDVGPSDTTAVLIPRDQPLSPETAADHAIPLRLRDLSQPVTVYDGAIPTVVEFDNLTFGSAALSRRSGRNNAFAWPSLVRVGCEAQRLRLRGNAVEGLTGGGDLHARLAETGRSDNMWRFSTADGATSRLGPLVNGEVLRHVGDDGEISHRPDGLLPAPTRPDAAPANPPVVRPRFSQSSLTGFFLVEVLLHAMSEINSAEPSSPFGKEAAGKTEIRRLERIIVTSPLAMAPEDRQLLVERVHNAIDLVWRTQRFDEATSLAHPEKPQVALSIGGDVGFQLIHLYDEVKRKFGGSFEAFAACVRRPGDDVNERLRMASIEVGMRALGLTVMDYELGADGTIDVQLVSTDRAAHGVERIADALAEVVIAPAIERALAAAGVADPRQFLIRFGEGALGVPGSGTAQDIKHLARRLESKVLRPAALQLVRHYSGLPPRAGLGVSRTRLDALVMAGGGRLDPTAGEFDSLAAAAGARGFSLAAVLVDSSRRQFERQLAIELWPGIDAACDAVAAMQCDLVVIGGDMSGLADILDRMTVNAPVAPGRVAVLTGRGNDGAANAGVDAVLAAYLASRGLLQSGQFRLATRKVADQLVLDAAPGKPSLQRDPRSPLTIEVSPEQRYERMS